MTAECDLHVPHAVALGCTFLTGIQTVQKWLILFDVTRGEAKGSAETSITDEVFTTVVIITVLTESKDPFFPLSRDLLTFSAGLLRHKLQRLPPWLQVQQYLTLMPRLLLETVTDPYVRCFQSAHCHRENVQLFVSLTNSAGSVAACAHYVVYIWFVKPLPWRQGMSKTSRGHHFLSTVQTAGISRDIQTQATLTATSLVWFIVRKSGFRDLVLCIEDQRLSATNKSLPGDDIIDSAWSGHIVKGFFAWDPISH